MGLGVRPLRGWGDWVLVAPPTERAHFATVMGGVVGLGGVAAGVCGLADVTGGVVGKSDTAVAAASAAMLASKGVRIWGMEGGEVDIGLTDDGDDDVARVM